VPRGQRIDRSLDLGDAAAMRHVLAALIISTILTGTAAADPLSDGDRQRVLAHFAMTDAWLASEVGGLTAAQQAWRPTPAAWSITDVVEHLAVAEAQYWTEFQASLTQPLGQKSTVGDDRILWYGIDRTQRDRTGEARVPTGRYKAAAEALAIVDKQRAEMRAFANTTKDDLRGRLLKGSPMDVYQWLLMISSHSQRHILQIREIKAAAGYPR
jgi:hypothetical protein